MFCPRCNTALDNNATFCGNCGALLSPQNTDMTRHEQANSAQRSPFSNDYTALSATVSAEPRPPSNPYLRQRQFDQTTINDAQPAQLSASPKSPRKPARRWRNLIIAILLIVLVIGGATGTAYYFLAGSSHVGTTSALGQVTFSDDPASSPGNTDALKISVSGLNNPTDGSQYKAWLIDNSNEQVQSLGALTKNGKNFALAFTGTSQGQSKNLVGLGNKIEITQEKSDVSLPTGAVMLSATFPPQAFVHIRHLLFKFPTTPNNTGLLVGLRNETQKVNTQALILQNAVNGKNRQLIQCIAQNMINIIEGKNGSDFQPLSSKCADQNVPETGDGFGILSNGYIAIGANHAALAASQPDSTDNIRSEAKSIETVIATIKDLMIKLNVDVLQVLTNPTSTDKVGEIVSLTDHAYHGFDSNGDGKIDVTSGEGGAITAYAHGQLIATLKLID